MELRGSYPLKTHRFWPICFLPMDNFPIVFFIFLSFSWFFCPIFLPPQKFRGGHPLIKNFRGTHLPCFCHLCVYLIVNDALLDLFVHLFIDQCLMSLDDSWLLDVAGIIHFNKRDIHTPVWQISSEFMKMYILHWFDR